MTEHSLPSIEKYKQKREIIALTCKQIIKDFQLQAEALSTDTEENELFPYLMRQMESILRVLIERNQTKLMNLLYTIDINEQHLKRTLQSEVDATAETVLAKLIVEREMKKVVTRLHFSNNPADRLLLGQKEG